MITKLYMDKEKYLNLVKEAWLKAETSFPDFLGSYPERIVAQNDDYLQHISGLFQQQVKNYPRLLHGRKKWRDTSITMIKDILYRENILGLHDSMDRKTIDAFIDEVFEFIRKVRSFAPKLSIGDIGQAVRNYIVYAMFKTIHQVDSGYSRAAFGYSMLYPITDNYIDNGQLSEQDKKNYNQLIRDKIEGNKVYPVTYHQKKTCELLQAIESEYPRSKDNAIYNLLLMMLDAQEISIKQQNSRKPLSTNERLDISIYKGGISVLIDRYLVNMELSEEDLIFYLSFGFFLQLADDLQDIKEDSILGHSTLFTLDLSCTAVEQLVNKLLHFLRGIMNNYNAENDQFKSFILSASYLLIITSALGSSEFFSDAYQRELYQYLPVTFSLLEGYLHKQVEALEPKLQVKYLHILDELIKK